MPEQPSKRGAEEDLMLYNKRQEEDFGDESHEEDLGDERHGEDLGGERHKKGLGDDSDYATHVQEIERYTQLHGDPQ